MRKLLPILAICALTLLSTSASAEETTVTQLGNVKIINSGPTTVTKLGHTTIINSPNSDVNFNIPKGSTVYFPNYTPYTRNNWYYPSQVRNPLTGVYSGQPVQRYCNAYGC